MGGPDQSVCPVAINRNRWSQWPGARILEASFQPIGVVAGDQAGAIRQAYERQDFVFDPRHFLALIEQKINAFDQVAPLADWKLPDEFADLRCRHQSDP